MKKKIVVIVLILILIVSISIIFFIMKSRGNQSGGILTDNKKNTITSKQIEEYGFDSIARWGDLALNISYLIPTVEGTTVFSMKGSNSYSYTHGHKFTWENGYPIYIEKSIEGSSNLYTLPHDINEEKKIGKYKYEDGSDKYVTLNIEKTEEIKINNMDTIYFESQIEDSSALIGLSISDVKVQYIGYSLEYNNQFISIYGQYAYKATDDEETIKITKEELKKRLQYIINSFKTYNGESFYELDNTFDLRSLYDDGAYNKEERLLTNGERQFVINTYGSHINNGNFGKYENRYETIIYVNPQEVNWDGKYDSIFQAIQTNESYMKKMCFKDWGDDIEFEVINEGSIKINGIDMKKYIIHHVDTTFNEEDYAVLYTFIVDGNPYIFQYQINRSFDTKDNLTEEQKAVIINNVDISGGTIIRTIRFVDSGKQWTDYVN